MYKSCVLRDRKETQNQAQCSTARLTLVVVVVVPIQTVSPTICGDQRDDIRVLTFQQLKGLVIMNALYCCNDILQYSPTIHAAALSTSHTVDRA